MEIFISSNPDALAQYAVDGIEELLAAKPEAVIGFATGSSPMAVYDEMAARYEAGRIDFSKAKGFQLDEYVGLPAGHEQTYLRFIHENMADRVNFVPGTVRAPDGTCEDLAAGAAAYEAAIEQAGGVDFQILGIGSNGHIAFNEPGGSLASATRVEALTEQTRQDNARFFDGDITRVPTHCVTQGLGTIMRARRIILLAQGEGKAEAIAHLVEGSVSARWPATILQHHPRVTLLLDEAAASKLELRDHYRWAWENRG